MIGNELEQYCGKKVDLEKLAKQLKLDIILCVNDEELEAIKFTAHKSGLKKRIYLPYKYINEFTEKQIINVLTVRFYGFADMLLAETFRGEK